MPGGTVVAVRGEKLERPVEAVGRAVGRGRRRTAARSRATGPDRAAPARCALRAPSTAAKPISAFVAAPLATIMRPASRTAAGLSSHGSQSGKSAIEGLRSTTTTTRTASSAKWSRTTNSSVPRAVESRADAAQSIRRIGVAAAIRTRARDLVARTPAAARAARDVERTAPCATGSAGRRGRRPAVMAARAARRRPSRDGARARGSARAGSPARPAPRRRARRRA